MRSFVVIALLASCYDVPQPKCGFQCSAADECPAGYACIGSRCALQDGRDYACPSIGMPDVTNPPGVMAIDPRNTEANVAIDREILVTFDEDVTGVNEQTFYVTRIDSSGDAVIGTVGPVGEGSRAFRFHPEALEKNATYGVTLTNAILDRDHQPLPFTMWTFSTERDDTAPHVLTSTPLHRATNVPTTATISVRFDEPVNVTPGSIQLLSPTMVVSTNLVAKPLETYQLVYEPPLLDNTQYTIAVTSAVTDLYGNAIVPTNLTFDSHDTIAPMIVSTDPMPDATGVPVLGEINIGFDEAILTPQARFHLSSPAGPVDFTISFEPQLFILTMSPIVMLEPSTTYTVSFDPIYDLAGNSASFPPFSFTTAP